MVQNFDIFDFKLSSQDIEKIKEIDTGESPFMEVNDPTDAIEFNEEIV